MTLGANNDPTASPERLPSPEQTFAEIAASFGEVVAMTAAQQELYYMDAVEDLGSRPVDGRKVKIVNEQPYVILDVVAAQDFIDHAPVAAEYFGIVPGANQFFDVTFGEECFVGDKEENEYTPPRVHINLRDGRNPEYTNYAEYIITGKNLETGEEATGQFNLEKDYSKKVTYDAADAAEAEILNKQVAAEHFILRGLEMQLNGGDEATESLPKEIDPKYHDAKEDWLIAEYLKTDTGLKNGDIGLGGQKALLELSQQFAAVYQKVIDEHRPRHS